MKKIVLFSLLLNVLLNAQIFSVKFQVNMNVQVLRTHFNPHTQAVFIAGSFNNWNPTASEMTDVDSDYVYTYILDGLTNGDTVEFKFIYGNQIWEEDPNRIYIIPNTSSEYYAYFNNDSLFTFTTIDINFVCDMTNEINLNNFNPLTDTLQLRSSFGGWFSNEYMLHPSIEDPGKYEIHVPFNTIRGEILRFKFAYISNNGIFWENSPNRCYTVNTNDTIFKNIVMNCIFNDSNFMTSGPIAFYPFNGNTNDESGNENHGVAVGGAMLSPDRFGTPDKAYYFDGIDDYIEIASSPTLESPSYEFTFTGWIKINSWDSTFAPFICKSLNNSSEKQYEVLLNESYIGFYTTDPALSFNTPFSFQLYQWYFIAITKTGTDIKIYVNGTLLDSLVMTGSLIQDVNPLTLGINTPGATEFLSGSIDDIRIYNRTISEEDIQFLYSENIIPVELISFSADVVDSKVRLNWITSTEVNNKGFEIERSITRGKSIKREWETIGFVPGAGTSTEISVYTFIDENITADTYSYRLKQIDLNGMYEYSSIISVGILMNREYKLFQNYPNPFNPSTKIKYSIPEGGRVVVKIFDILGKEVITLTNEYKDAGYYEIEFSAENLASGIYFYKIVSGSYSEIKKMVLLR